MVKKENEQDLVKLKKHWLRQNSLSPRSFQPDSDTSNIYQNFDDTANDE